MTKQILRLHAAWSWAPDEDGAAIVSSPLSRRRLRIVRPDPSVPVVLDALRAGVEINGGGLAAAFPSDRAAVAMSLTATLDELGALVRRDPDDDVMALTGDGLYDRQIRFLSYYETPEISGLEMNRRLQESTVLVAGLGGLGGWIALLCARLGVRRIIGVDPDDVELSNLHRQILYSGRHLGQAKARVAEEALCAVDPQVRFVGHALWINEPGDLTPLLDGVDLVINPFPHIPSFARAARAVAEAAVQAGTAALNMPMTHGVGPLTVPGVTACIACAWEKLRRRYRIDEATAVTAPSWHERGFLAALAPRQAVSGGIAVWEAVRFLTGMSRPRTLDGVAFVDIADFSAHDFLPVARDPACVVCASIGAGTQEVKS